jgi:hypothetical protein
VWHIGGAYIRTYRISFKLTATVQQPFYIQIGSYDSTVAFSILQIQLSSSDTTAAFFISRLSSPPHPDELPFLFRHYTSGGAHAYYLFGFRFCPLLLPRLLLSGFYLRFHLLAPAEADGGE